MISLPDNHPIVVLANTVDWTEMEVRAEKIRERKLKNAAGRPPHLRATLGALTLMAIRRLPYREVEEQIRYYAPARYLCGLTETDWTPDFTTIQDFAQLLGEDGVKLINEGVVQQAVKLGTGRREGRGRRHDGARSGYSLSQRGRTARRFCALGRVSDEEGRSSVQGLFGQDHRQTQDGGRQGAQLSAVFQNQGSQKSRDLADGQAYRWDPRRIGQSTDWGGVAAARGRLRGCAQVAQRKLALLHQSVTKLLPQIRYWLRTGYVATGKLINLRIPELYAIVGGKVGKSVEFGLSWGITRLKGGFILATMAGDRNDLQDSRFAVRAPSRI